MRRLATALALLLFAGSLLACAGFEERRRKEAEFKQQIDEYNAKQTDPDKKIVCKKITKTGTRIPERVCRTRRQWRGIQTDSQEAIRRLRPADRPKD